MISHRMEGGVEKPIAFASRTLALAEKNYSQLEKEALAIVFAVKKFERTKVMYRCPQPFATTIYMTKLDKMGIKQFHLVCTFII